MRGAREGTITCRGARNAARSPAREMPRDLTSIGDCSLIIHGSKSTGTRGVGAVIPGMGQVLFAHRKGMKKKYESRL